MGEAALLPKPAPSSAAATAGARLWSRSMPDDPASSSSECPSGPASSSMAVAGPSRAGVQDSVLELAPGPGQASLAVAASQTWLPLRLRRK